MSDLAFTLTLIRAFLYPLSVYFILTMAFSTNNRNRARVFTIHVLTAVIFSILGLMTLVRLFFDSESTISNLGNYAITPVLIVFVASLIKFSIQEEKRYVKETKKLMHLESQQ